MQQNSLTVYRCPSTHGRLRLVDNDSARGAEILRATLVAETGTTYPVTDGIPDFTIGVTNDKNEYAIALFREKAKEYDKYQHLSFETFYEDETAVRNAMIDKLRLAPDSTVLEINAGTGRDSVLIAQRLTRQGMLHVQDLSREMLEVCRVKLQHTDIPTEIHQGNACALPYADHVFDAVYSFGGVGMNTYSDNKDAIAEMVRVTKTGGRIVFGGLSLAPWLRDTFFAKVLINHNTHYANEITFNNFPIQARDVNVGWILAGAGFVVDFTVGNGEPKANFEYEIPGPRGGTLLTRYAGKLEGVTPETKDLALQATAKLGVSMHAWLDELVKNEAKKIIHS
jgi:ubiquinone/menaquinone biosynthesis C-methylase UbiE/uncharacterized protein YbaR (Trm112 family)